ncbi:hypothetical protein CVT25_009353 [Psilocybe cyanescens]|uniref:Uncharacterized protein n=1 Tax=Psilocybe cyanescens TaxID=93625 RepID=A0A409XUW6_PSICY|nr:hypothetical protein CVT25_009353 [Psilocybe cyanescens]
MELDCDWCLTCEKHIENDSPYCSLECQERAAPSEQGYCHQEQYSEHPSSLADEDNDAEVIYHPIEESSFRWAGNDFAGISAWASQVPYGAPAGVSSPCEDVQSFCSPQGSTYRPPPPSLLSHHRRTLPPSLSMATPPHVRPPPSNPMLTPKRQPSFASITPTGNASMGQTSLRSAATGSSLVATPYSSQPVPIVRKQSLLDGMYSHVRSWVSPAPVQQRPQTPVLRVNPSKLISHARSTAVFPVKVVSSPRSSCDVSEKSALCWMTSTVVVKPTLQEKPCLSKPQRGRKLVTDLPFRHDDHPSFRTRGRKASRAAA